MSSRRKLKKSIQYICSELFGDCVSLSLCQDQNQEKLEDLMKAVLSLYTDYISRINHTDKGNAKEYYKQLKQEFRQKSKELSEKIIQS